MPPKKELENTHAHLIKIVSVRARKNMSEVKSCRKHLLLLQKTWLHFPVPKLRLTTP